MGLNEPRILCFMCNWAFCQNEIPIPSNVNVVRVMCIGRMDPPIVLDMLANGADGVMLVGCKPPDCHYVEGNLEAERAAKILKKLIILSGIEPERIQLLWFSPLTKERDFTYRAIEFSEEMTRLGPSPLKNKDLEPKLMVNILAARNATSDFRLRVLLGREKELTEVLNVYGEKIPQGEFDGLLDEIVEAEFIRHKIHLLTKTKPLPVKALAEAVKKEPATVLRHIVNMRKRNMIALDHVEGTTPFYKALEVK